MFRDINDIPKQDYLVLCNTITYNHAPYITDTINGFCMQQTNFPYVCYIIDDASTDGEQDMIEAYLNEHFQMEAAEHYELELANVIVAKHNSNPNCTFAVYLLKRNLWKEPDLKYSHRKPWTDQCKYIALCEGDDYWTDPLKLQKQVDILEADESLMACCTNCSVVDMKGNILEEKRVQPVVKDNKQGRYSLREFFNQGHQYPTLSVLYRNAHRDEVRQKTATMSNPYMGDWTLWIALLCFGDMYYLDEVTCAYRINPTSLTHDQSKLNQRRLGQAKDNFRLMPLVASCLPDDYQDKKDDLLNNTTWMWYRLAIAYKHVGQYLCMAYALLRCELNDPGFVRRERKRK